MPKDPSSAPQKATNLSNAQKRQLRGKAHSLKPIVMVGDKGLTENVMGEIDDALAFHELIKVRLRAERDTRKAFTETITSQTRSTLVDSIGQIVVLFRRNPDKPKVIV